MSLLYGNVPRRPDPEPLELDDTRIVALGTLGWLVALVVLLVADLLGADIHGWWLAMCGSGAVLGVCGLRYVALRRRATPATPATPAPSAAPESTGPPATAPGRPAGSVRRAARPLQRRP